MDYLLGILVGVFGSFIIMYVVLQPPPTTIKDFQFAGGVCEERAGLLSVKRDKNGLQITCRNKFQIGNLRPFIEG